MALIRHISFIVLFITIFGCSTGNDGDIFLRVRAVLEPSTFNINCPEFPLNFEYDVFYNIPPGYYSFDYVDYNGTQHPQLGELSVLEVFSNSGSKGGLFKSGENGAQWGKKETYHIETKDTSDALKVDKMWYTFPVGDNITAFVGPRIENYYMYVTPSIYQPGALKSMKLGGNSNFGASTDVGYGFKYETDGGFAFASNVVSKNADSDGMLGKNDHSKWDTQIAYTTDRWHVSGTLSNQQGWTGQAYNATAQAVAIADADGEDATGYALRAYWRPENTGTATPEISVGYDTRSADNTVAAGTGKDSDSYFVGLTWRDMFQADDRIGFAVTQPLKVTECNGTCTTADVDPIVYEAYYSFRPNDSMEIRPAIFGGTDVENSTEDDIFGAVVTTVFKF